MNQVIVYVRLDMNVKKNKIQKNYESTRLHKKAATRLNYSLLKQKLHLYLKKRENFIVLGYI